MGKKKSVAAVLMKIAACFLALLFAIMVGLHLSIPQNLPEGISVLDANKVSEYDYIAGLQAASDEELVEAGFSSQEISRIRRFSFRTALWKRSLLSKSKLANYGYSDEQIVLLRAYAKGAKLTAAQFRGLLALFEGTVTQSEVPDGNLSGTTAVSVVFSWSWSHRPLWEGTDSVACSFRGVNGSNQDVGVMRAASGCTVRYVSDETAGDRVSTAYELESGGYDIPQAMQAGAETYWAESGSFSITVREIVEVNELEEVVFVFGYNHMGSDNRERVLALSESSSQQMIPMCSFRYVAGLSG